jgi:hypothetical protein
LTIEKVVWQLLPMSISPAERERSKIGNSSHPGQSDDRRKSSPYGKKMKTNAPEGRELFYRFLLLPTAYCQLPTA